MKIRITLEVEVGEQEIDFIRSWKPEATPAEAWLNSYDLLCQTKGQDGCGSDQHITLVGFEPVA